MNHWNLPLSILDISIIFLKKLNSIDLLTMFKLIIYIC